MNAATITTPNPTDNVSRLTQYPDRFCVSVTNGDALIFCSAGRGIASNEFMMQSCLIPSDVGTTRRIDGKCYRVGAHGGSARIRIDAEGNYAIGTIEPASDAVEQNQ